ncbi:hypothetical protein Q428_03220 [Fervidicella metallireducens AeB]|uniref:DNA-binding protein n=1 Tax=Fervidicella metallireducens AeB TaxID=1403537 RepID=A0A017RZD3_9CLOT|nr:DUF177 domain-containing protein [Fervidicella metallireducens]EYE89300.1 hypothetical protein Q428_03220 [Fervidicella metallireducens AeB]
MILDVSRLLTKKVDQMKFEMLFETDQIERDDFQLELVSPISVVGNAYYDGEIVNVIGNISLVIKTLCSRCLNSVDYHLTIDFDELFSKSKRDEDIYPFSENYIDLKDMVIDNIIMSLPFKPLCSEECKGLCPVCGKNLNLGQCDCNRDNIDPRFAALKDLFKGK